MASIRTSHLCVPITTVSALKRLAGFSVAIARAELVYGRGFTRWRDAWKGVDAAEVKNGRGGARAVSLCRQRGDVVENVVEGLEVTERRVALGMLALAGFRRVLSWSAISRNGDFLFDKTTNQSNAPLLMLRTL
jgi:hypothetical protein